MTTETQNQDQEIQTQDQTETQDYFSPEYFRRVFFEKDILKDSWILLKEVKIAKTEYKNIFLFSWHPSVLYVADTIPMGLGLPRDYDQFVEFLQMAKLTPIGKIALSVEGEPILQTLANDQILSSAELVINELLDQKVLKKFLINQHCIDPELWVGLTSLYNRLMGSVIDLKQVTARSICTPTLKTIGQYKKALKGAMDF